MTEQRLSRQGKFAWPIPEIVTIFIAAVSFVLFREDENFDINTFSEMILPSAVISLPIGIPLVLTKVRFLVRHCLYCGGIINDPIRRDPA